MSGYTKLFGSILDSTVWELPSTSRIVWVTLMAMADRHGEVQAAIPGLAYRARVTLEETEAALASFMAPDKYSRTPDQDGRRIEPIDGGWRLVNHEKYAQQLSAEDRRERGAERQRRHAERKASASVSKRQQASAPVSDCQKRQNDDTQTHLQIQTQTEEKKDPSPAPPARVSEPSVEFLKFWDVIKSPRRKGERAEAYEAWIKAGKPEADYLVKQWSAYLRSLGETYPKDVCRWLRKGIFRGPFEGASRGHPVREIREGPPMTVDFAAHTRQLEENAERERLAAAERFKRDREAAEGT